MSDDALDFADYLLKQQLQAEIVAPGAHMPTVDAAASAVGVSPEQIFKSILFQSPAGRCVLVVASGNARVDVRRVEGLTGIVNLKLAKPEVVFAKTGYPAGGTPPLGHRERIPVIVDTRVAAQPWGYAGGGRVELLVKIQTADIIRLGQATVADVVAKNPRTM
ncbi:MAG: Cys-tRNA(Pro) deacylase [candidate division NC10 bacterium]|jgi:prolyl-tRNA editing enzyme YbaK/EbsC (Cys-tRNA(Pro) deacylase)|nr:Cys-tRNA(Pro) deacylase [candidate division NC10 bacterium]